MESRDSAVDHALLVEPAVAALGARPERAEERDRRHLHVLGVAGDARDVDALVAVNIRVRWATLIAALQALHVLADDKNPMMSAGCDADAHGAL